MYTSKATGKPKILVTGMTSLRSGAMESDNLGNFVIIEPLFRSLREEFPASEIQTTLQLSDQFAAESKVEVLRVRSFYEYDWRNSVGLVWQLMVSLLWRAMLALKIDLVFILAGSARLKALLENDLIVDFSGDMFGDNSLNQHHFLAGAATPVLASLLGKTAVSVASSPGPFSSKLSIYLAKFSLERFDLVAVREPVSLQLLHDAGFAGDKFQMYPCFSFGFRPSGALADEVLSEKEPGLYSSSRPLTGIILSNLNMMSPPPSKWPRQDEEYEPFVQLATHLVREKKSRVCFLSHRNKISKSGRPSPGSDHSIITRVMELLPGDVRNQAFMIDNIYDAATMNKLIGRFDVLVSGRIHGAVQGIMQCIPTLVIDYGMEPKAHKLKGFTLLCGLNGYLCEPNDVEQLKKLLDQLWEQRSQITEVLKTSVPNLVQQSHEVWGRVRDLCESGP